MARRRRTVADSRLPPALPAEGFRIRRAGRQLQPDCARPPPRGAATGARNGPVLVGLPACHTWLLALTGAASPTGASGLSTILRASPTALPPLAPRSPLKACRDQARSAGIPRGGIGERPSPFRAQQARLLALALATGPVGLACFTQVGLGCAWRACDEQWSFVQGERQFSHRQPWRPWSCRNWKPWSDGARGRAVPA